MSNILKFPPRPPSSGPKRLLVVGQGAAGAAAKAELADLAELEGFASQISIDICEPRAPSFDGMGIAWSPKADWLRCNMPLPTIWWDEQRPAEFSEELDLKWSNPYAELFPSRHVVGTLLHQRSREVDLQAAAAGLALNRIASSVVDIRRTPAGIDAVFADGSTTRYDAVILAIGNVPSTQYSHLSSHPHFINSAWDPDEWLASIKVDDHVVILGTSVTAVDAAISLRMARHRGKIIMVSRGGMLPGSRTPHRPGHKLKFLSKQMLAYLRAGSDSGFISLPEVHRLVRAEFAAAGVSRDELEEVFATSRLPAESWLSHGLERVDRPSAYFTVMKALDDLFPDLWNATDFRGRARYLERFHADYARVAWPMAPKNARIILDMLKSKQLSVLANLETCLPSGDGFMVLLSKGEMIRAETVINASGIGGELSRMGDPLTSNMLASGLILPNPFGGGLTDFETGRLLDESGVATGPVWATTGALSRGDRLLTNVLSEAGLSGRRTARAVAEFLGLRRASAA